MQNAAARSQGDRLRAAGRDRGAAHAHRGRSGRLPRRGGGLARLQGASLRLAHHRLDGGHQAHHARGDPRLLQDVLRAEQRHRGGGGRLPRRRRDGEDPRRPSAPSRGAPTPPPVLAVEPPQNGERRTLVKKDGAAARSSTSAITCRTSSRRTRPRSRCSPRCSPAAAPRASTRTSSTSAARARRRRRLLLLLARPESLLVLGDAAAGPDAGGDGAGAARRDGAAQERGRDRGGAAARQEPDRGGVRLPGGLGPPPRLAARRFELIGGYAAHGPASCPPSAPSPRPTCDARRARVLPRRQEERGRPAAQPTSAAPASSSRRRRPHRRRRPGDSDVLSLLASRNRIATRCPPMMPLARPARGRCRRAAGGGAARASRGACPTASCCWWRERPAVPIVAVRVLRPRGRGVRSGRSRRARATSRGRCSRAAPRSARDPSSTARSSSSAAASRPAPAATGMTVSLAVLRKDLALGLDLLAEVLLRPTFPEAELKRKVAQIEAGIKRSEEDPDTVAQPRARALGLPQPSVRPPVGGHDRVGRQAHARDVVEFHRARYRPDTTIIAVVGAVTVDEARQSLVDGSSGWARRPVRRRACRWRRVAPAESERIKRELTQATCSSDGRPCARSIPTTSRWSSRPTSSAAARPRACTTRVRDEGGLAYSVGSYARPRALRRVVRRVRSRRASTA